MLGDVDYLTAESQLSDVGAHLLVDTLRDLPKRQEESKAQDPSKATFARKLTSEDAKVSWEDMTACQIARKHRGISHQVCQKQSGEFAITTILTACPVSSTHCGP